MFQKMKSLLSPKPTEQIVYPPKGVWLWDLDTLPKDIVELCVKANVGRVYLKILDDKGGGKLWEQAQVIPQFIERGIQVFGWGYHFTEGKIPNAANIANSINQCTKMGMRGYVFDFESELEGSPVRTNLAIEMIRYVKKNMHRSLTLGFTSFGMPDYHPGFPWKEISAEVDCEFRQTYYVHWKGDAATNIKKSLAPKFGKPVYPIFSTELGGKYQVSNMQHQEFLDQYGGASMWRAGDGATLILDYRCSPVRTLSRLYDFYSKEENYHKVEDGVRKFYPGFRSNGCVAFMSEALRLCRYAVPNKPGLGGDNISLVTKPFSHFLSTTLGFQLINSPDKLLPGDVCFTTDAPGWPTFPAHTYLFCGWYDKSKGLGYVIDNQAFKHVRNIIDQYGDYNFSPFVYALRPT